MKNVIHQIEKVNILLFTKITNNLNQLNLQQLALFFTRIGDGPFYLSMIPVIMLTLPHCLKSIAVMSIAIGLEKTVYLFLKKHFKRQRPCIKLPYVKQVMIPPDEFSFPSGHSATAFCMATMLSFYYPLLMISLYMLATMIGISRLILKVHFPLDILVGSLLGSCCAYSMLSLFYPH